MSERRKYAFERIDGAARRLHVQETIEDWEKTLVEEACRLSGAKAAQVFRADDSPRVPCLCVKREGETVRVPFGQGIAGAVAKESGYYSCANPARDELYLEAVDGLPGQEVKNLLSLAMPAGERVLGVLQLYNVPGRGFTEEDASFLGALCEHAGQALAQLDRLESARSLVRSLVEAISTAVDHKHIETVGHSDRVTQMSLGIGRRLGLSPRQLLVLEMAARLHDVGRLVMNYPQEETGQFGVTAVERTRDHIHFTEAILRHVKFPPFLEGVAEVALAHHEGLDGSGFPRGWQGKQLGQEARILMVANTFDCLVTGRLGGRKMDPAEAIAYLGERAGRVYDVEVVRALVDYGLGMVEKRRFPRAALDWPLQVTVLSTSPAEAEDAFQAQAIDISESGIMFRSEKELAVDTLLRLSIALPTEKVEAIARVARVIAGKDHFRVGAHFLWFGSV